ncbi:MAG: (d)CMP kinase [Muribaculaceae bacterium]|nr:(d)CMP kinase [Muribaculaceae bacterium]MBQ5408328.1 (d)CMP kinase [Muribaculaceae bacterium]MBQ5509495.1 (d)CMP kinase [Muribaculaceae bacterium]MDY6292885.1 (d)CMP kinase [Bacteroidales bacterium]MDY6413327.1 (d)CMP kinase [Bacteroidales bacterium]
MNNKRITIAIDGHSSCGKSTMAKALAKRIGYAYIDTGAMYRAVTLYCLEHDMIKGDEVNKPRLRRHMPKIEITFKVNNEGKSETWLNGKNVEQEIRGMEVSSKVSLIAAIGFVRRAMVAQQQVMGKEKGIVMDGRDIGTVVFPDAELKFFVTASAQVRAERRFKELQAKGDTTTTLEQVLANVEERDRIDSTRKESPLRQAPDALLLDNSNLTIEQQNEWLYNEFLKRVKQQ